MAIRAMFGLLFIVLIVYLIAKCLISIGRRISHAKCDQPIHPKVLLTGLHAAQRDCLFPMSRGPSSA
jgi:hypothetical protein